MDALQEAKAKYDDAYEWGKWDECLRILDEEIKPLQAGETSERETLERLAADHAHQAEMWRHRTTQGEIPEFAADYIRTQTKMAAYYASQIPA